MKTDLLQAEKTHLSNLIEAIQRCVYSLMPFQGHYSEVINA